MKHRIAILSFFLIGLILIDFSMGSTYIPFSDVFHFLIFKLDTQNEYYTILSQLRLPRVLSAIAASICLSISGLLMQNYFRNPLAGPYVLGISSGASLGVATFILSGNFLNNPLTEWFIHIGISGAAILGSMTFLLVIFFISLRLQNSVSVLIAGILLGTAANAIISFLQNISSGLQLQSFVYWNMGSLQNASSQTSFIILIVTIICLVVLLKFSSWLDLWLTGDEQAKSAGVSQKYYSLLTFSITSLLIGLSTAFYGPVAFVGLISPHVARMIFQTQIHKRFLIYTTLIGIFVMLIADIILQLFAFTNLPLNTVISLLSLPVLVYLFIKKKELWM